MRNLWRFLGSLPCFALGGLLAAPAQAEVAELKVAKQYGITYLPLMLMEADKLVEKHAKAEGLESLVASWTTFGGGSAMNDAILSGSLHLASGGIAPLITIWAKTKGNMDVRCVTAMSRMPIYLTTRNPAVKTLRDFTDKDRIALPAVKVSMQAITLQMAAEQTFGAGNHNRLDHLTVSMSHPDGQQVMLSAAGEVTAHFSSPPFQYQQLRHPGITRVVSSYDVLGGPSTFTVMWATGKFMQENPRTARAFMQAFDEAIATINADKRSAAARYLAISRDKRSSLDDVLGMLNDPEIAFSKTPSGIQKYADFMLKIGSVKAKAQSWKDVCFSHLHSLSGS
jgi:NitT/TauT family transport system substrate-binding protein